MTAYDLARRLVGRVSELPGAQHHPCVQWAHMEAGLGPDQPDETPWCGSFVGLVAMLCGLPRPVQPALARAWLAVGHEIAMVDARTGYDIVILRRGTNPAQGHVGFFAGVGDEDRVFLLGGNQGNKVSIAPFAVADVLGIRRLQQ